MPDLHKLLASTVVSGLTGHKLCKIECPDNHLVGYAKVPEGAEPQMIAVECHECSAIAGIGSPLVAQDAPKPEAPKKTEEPYRTPEKPDLDKLPDEELAALLRTVPKKSPLAKEIISIRSKRSHVRTRQAKEQAFLEEMKEMSDSVDVAWEGFRPGNCQEALDHLIAAHPYVFGEEIPHQVFFTAFWLAHNLWQDKFVDQLFKAWKFPSAGALRQRIGKLWDWLENSVKLKMPFMAKAHIAPVQAQDALQKLIDKAKLDRVPDRPTFTVLYGEGTRDGNLSEEPPLRRVDANTKEPPIDPVLAFTRGRRAVIAGGQGARESHREAIQEVLQLKELDWVYGERGQQSHLAALAKRVRKYDFVFFLSGYSGHTPFTDACKAQGVKIIYVTRGYSINQIIEAIKDQALQPKYYTGE